MKKNLQELTTQQLEELLENTNWNSIAKEEQYYKFIRNELEHLVNKIPKIRVDTLNEEERLLYNYVMPRKNVMGFYVRKQPCLFSTGYLKWHPQRPLMEHWGKGVDAYDSEFAYFLMKVPLLTPTYQYYLDLVIEIETRKRLDELGYKGDYKPVKNWNLAPLDKIYLVVSGLVTKVVRKEGVFFITDNLSGVCAKDSSIKGYISE